MMNASLKRTFGSDRTKNIWFLVGVFALLILALLLFFVLRPGGGGGLLKSDAYTESERQIGVIVPTLQEEQYFSLCNSISEEASYYDWKVFVVAADTEGGLLAAAEKLIKNKVEAIIADPQYGTGTTQDDLEKLVDSAGIPCVLLLDDGEENDVSAPSVYFDLQYMGTDMAYKCSPGKAFVIFGDAQNYATKLIENGLLYDEQYGLYNCKNVVVEGVAYVETGNNVRETIERELERNPDINTFLVADPEISYDALLALENAGYTGDLICYTNEFTIGQMRKCRKNTTIIFEYFHLSDISYYCVMAVGDKVEYKIKSQHYTIYPYSW